MMFNATRTLTRPSSNPQGVKQATRPLLRPLLAHYGACYRVQMCETFRLNGTRVCMVDSAGHPLVLVATPVWFRALW